MKIVVANTSGKPTRDDGVSVPNMTRLTRSTCTQELATQRVSPPSDPG
jgi:hypothetical protein